VQQRQHQPVHSIGPVVQADCRDRLEYFPDGRQLHCVDIENCMGGPSRGRPALEWAAEAYRRAASVRAQDHIIVAADRSLVFDCHEVFPRARILAGTGPDGADQALLATLTDPGLPWIAQRFDRVVIGSGDHAFSFAARRLVDLGVEVGIVAIPGSISGALVRCSSFVLPLTRSVSRLEVR